MFLSEAILRAKVLDQTLRETGKPVGPLHGLPISLKVRTRHSDPETW
jgi:amidase